MLERSGAAQIGARTRTLRLPKERVAALGGLEDFNPVGAIVGVGLIGAGWLAYRLIKRGTEG